MEVRRADLYDFSGICRLLSQWHEESPVNYPEWLEDDAINWIARTMTKGVVFIAIDDESGKIIGSIGLSGQHYPWNMSVWMLECEWLHVDPDHRKGRVAEKLLDSAKSFADDYNSSISVSSMQGLNAELKDRFISMCGLDYVGGTFVYGL